MRNVTREHTGWAGRLALLIVLVLLCVALAHAQGDDLSKDVSDYHSGFSVLKGLALTLGYAAIALTLVAAALGVTLAYLRLPVEIDQDFLIWLGTVWGGGLVISIFACKALAAMTHVDALAVPGWQAALIAIPCLFGWTVLMSTRNFADLTWGDAWRVAVVVAVVSAPWFGTPWRFQSAPPPALSRVIPAPTVAAAVATLAPVSYRL
jgi:hypothetical protein